MKKWMKVTLIAGGILVAAGIGMITAATMNGGGNSLMGVRCYDRMGRNGWRYRYGENPVEERSIEQDSIQAAALQEEYSFSGVTELEVEHCAGTARITESEQLEENEILIRQYGEGLSFQLRQEGTELNISLPRQPRMHFREILEPQKTMKDLEILVPVGFRFHELDIENIAGNFVAEVIQADKLSVELVSGRMEILGGTVKMMDLEIISGSISSRAVTEGGLSVESISGDVELLMAGDIGDYDYQVERNGGQIMLNGSTLVDYSGQIGNTRIDNHTGKEIELECVGGGIMIQYEAASQNAL